MMRKSKTVIFTLCAAAFMYFTGAARAEKEVNDEEEFAFAQAPAAVQDTMRRVAGSAVPDELDKDLENGVVVYQGEYRTGAGENSIKVAENGDLLEVKKEVAASKLPEAVKASVGKAFAGASIKKAREVYLKGATTPGYYDVRLAGTQKKRIKVRPTGEIVS